MPVRLHTVHSLWCREQTLSPIKKLLPWEGILQSIVVTTDCILYQFDLYVFYTIITFWKMLRKHETAEQLYMYMYASDCLPVQNEERQATTSQIAFPG